MLYRLVTFLGYVALTTLTAWGVSDDYYLGGIQVNEEDHNKWVDALKHQEMNTVSVTIYAKHEKWDTDELTFEKEDPGLLAEIRVANKGCFDSSCGSQ